MPAGPLRAPLAAQIERTDALVVIGEGNAADGVAGVIAGQGKPVLSAHFRPDESSLAALRGKRALAFAGIGDPARFFATLRTSGVGVARTRSFPDHHPLSAHDAASLVAQATSDGLTLVTTEKDLARLRSTDGLPQWARAIVPFKVTLEFDDAAALRKFVSAQLFKAREMRRAG
jgi:tetraacyldisaccharide 4'-kinase